MQAAECGEGPPLNLNDLKSYDEEKKHNTKKNRKPQHKKKKRHRPERSTEKKNPTYMLGLGTNNMGYALGAAVVNNSFCVAVHGAVTYLVPYLHIQTDRHS
jgi:hypothetical protein